MKKEPMHRLTADEGKLITNGKFTGLVIDVSPNDNPDNYYEIDAPVEEEPATEEQPEIEE